MVNRILFLSGSWCGPCKALHNELKDFTMIPIVDLDADDNEHIITKYNVKSLPTLIFLDENENVLSRHVGFITKEQLSNKIIEINEISK